MKAELISALILVLTNIAAAAIGWIFSRRKYMEEVQGLAADTERKEIENLREMVGVYQTIINDLKKEMEELKAKVSKLEEQQKQIK